MNRFGPRVWNELRARGVFMWTGIRFSSLLVDLSIYFRTFSFMVFVNMLVSPELVTFGEVLFLGLRHGPLPPPVFPKLKIFPLQV